MKANKISSSFTYKLDSDRIFAKESNILVKQGIYDE